MTTDEPLPARLGDCIAGKYRIERVLGRGGMGVVFAARHLLLREQVALKMLTPELAQHGVVVARFLREARAAAMIKGDHVVRVLDVDSVEGRTFLVMEYLDGENLGDLLDREGSLSVEASADFVLQACDALAEAHAAGIVHRDLKPANLFVNERRDGSRILKVLDFGISKFDPVAHGEPSLTDTSHPLGTPLYMSPEQLASSASVDARTDVWALGVVLFECIAGVRPFRSIIDTLHAEPPLVESASELMPVISRCLSKNPADRFANVGDLAAALAPFASAEGVRVAARIARFIARHDREITLVDRVYSLETLSPLDPALVTTEPATTRPLPAASAPKQAANSPPTLGAVSSTPTRSVDSTPRHWPFIALAGGIAALVIAMAWRSTSSSVEPPRLGTQTSSAGSPSTVATPSQVSAQPPSATTAPTPVAAPTTTTTASAKTAPSSHVRSSCTPPYVIDSSGTKRWKLKCL